MYCVKCGVKLADSEKKCPLCGTAVYHPDVERGDGDDLYPKGEYPKVKPSSKIAAIVLTVLFILPAVTVLLCDLEIYGGVTWSGYVLGALFLAYVSVVLPMWFTKPNPVIFVPCAFASVGAYVLYINLTVGGGWFLSFAFPVVAITGFTVTAVVTLLRYVKKGALYILGGAIAFLGLSMLPMEFLANYTFEIERFMGWSLYPLAVLVLVGGFLIFIGAYRPARETMERIFFI